MKYGQICSDAPSLATLKFEQKIIRQEYYVHRTFAISSSLLSCLHCSYAQVGTVASPLVMGPRQVTADYDDDSPLARLREREACEL